MFESVPTYPHPYRYWDLVQTHKITQFYTAPTASKSLIRTHSLIVFLTLSLSLSLSLSLVRALMRFDASEISKYDLSSLKILGTVGEPINPEAWKWYYTHVGRENCTIVDSYWQTETGAHIGCNLPGIVPMKPGKSHYTLISQSDNKLISIYTLHRILYITILWY